LVDHKDRMQRALADRRGLNLISSRSLDLVLVEF
jgi:hypothetical protein